MVKIAYDDVMVVATIVCDGTVPAKSTGNRPTGDAGAEYFWKMSRWDFLSFCVRWIPRVELTPNPRSDRRGEVCLRGKHQ